MTTTSDNVETGVADPDLVVQDQTVGKNVYYAGSRIPDLPSDDSLRPNQRAQHVVPPNSLLWKYMADPFVVGATGQRAAILENLWPQLGQGVSDHSVIVSGHNGGFDKIIQRGRSTAKTIPMVVFSTPEEARKYGVQVRNFHKSIKGDMPNGRKYHAINAETYYWAHVTFFEAIYRASDLGVLERPLSREEKAQIFEESKEWFSLYGVDDRAQPQTYDEFESYLKDVFDNRLVNSKLAQYTVGFARKTLPLNAFPEKYRPLARPLLPLLRTPLRWLTVPVLEPQIRDLLGLDWSEKEERRFRRYIKSLRFVRLAMMRLHVPLRFRYAPFAIDAFQREGINPDEITLESARAALAEHRAARQAV
ncbi:Uncharacterized protein conserved in bacteria [Mycobacteroides abscessus subsp. abscessus]|uniref:oxygenase MpaB family protein n=1 Tax=Mycobacteroides abscessus TaxID=36809 RepID=UPI0005DBEA37|nr:oxygenase MpaB family protein [Mycobacteroides abscessus]MDM1884294.1 oxygenase MpaB family protein [Mycobacteroides abscessus]MDM1890240.1 oxygenase MpaB family protein [Mycobacteroides abscessus]MDO3199549.1 oxygenase MpaB family protein [Mycobacteroides abscessus subsp. abscessus]MDO3218020.1 oxygenase MpaB family protein [Mycobacteroides abscessus subsp. abscessus]PVB44413.1 DUF2236 domain-containing protein [Mycobacteroides abscessus]